MLRRTLAALLVMACIGPWGTVAFGQAWPSKPLRIIVPFPPGNAGDVTARSVADRLSQRLGLYPPTTTAQFNTFLRREFNHWGATVKPLKLD